MCAKYDLGEYKNQSVPISPGQELIKGNHDLKEYRALIGALMYTSVVARPDISYSIGILSRFTNAADEHLINIAKRLLVYLRDNAKKGLLFKWGQELEMKAYCDADFAMCTKTRKSITGWVIFYCGTPIDWSSKRQKLVTASTAEAEYVSFSDVSRNVIVIKQMLKDFNMLQEGPVTVFEDNNGCIAMAKNPEGRNRTKHIEVKYHYGRQCIENGDVEIKRVDTKNQIADGFTKALGRTDFNKFKDMLTLKDWNGNHDSRGALDDESSSLTKNPNRD
jgi:hypothetical protein